MKKDILRAANYRYDFDRDLFINRAVKKAFSIEFVDDTPEEDLRRLIRESTNGNGWQFYFNVPPTEGTKRELERVLG
ncbi:MAG TPA: hypothetical protein VHX13_06045 [Acidobacteriaceae bacterium]|jgi:hypothetical protein|nr:hypothetical protein [Acidobacteriaceae bacterium]